MNKEKTIEKNDSKREQDSTNNKVVRRTELIKMVSEKLDREYPQDAIYWIIQATFRCFEDILREGKTLKVADCFTMEPKLVKAARRYNFAKKCVFVKPAYYEPNFKPYRKLREACLSLPVKENEENSNDDEG